MPDKPSLGLFVEVTSADGVKTRLDAQTADKTAAGLTFSTRRGDGFLTASFTLPRRIDRDYIDLRLLDDIAIISGDGTVAYEGRVSSLPRSMQQTHQWTVNAVGWMAHAKDRTFTEVFVDRDFTGWGGPPLNEQIRLASGGTDLAALGGWNADNGGLSVNLPSTGVPTTAIAEAWYTAPPGCLIAKIEYAGSDTGVPAGYLGPRFLLLPGDSYAAVNDNLPATLDGTLRALGSGLPSRHVVTDLYANGVATQPSVGALRRFTKLAVYGNHGLAVYATGDGPDGVTASDVIVNLASRFCPKLDTSGVQPTTYPIAHLTYPIDTTPYDAFVGVNKFHLWDLAVWERKKLTYGPWDLNDYDWQIRLSDQNVAVDLQGDTAEDLSNGVVVSYTDVATGLTARITPDDNSALALTDPTNEVVRHGGRQWTTLQLSRPTNATGAVQLAQVYLAEYNTPKAPGAIVVTGHIRDRAGHWQPCSRVRAGDRVAIIDHPTSRPRMIEETSYSHGSSPSVQIAVEGPPRRVSALFDRIDIRP